MKHSLKILIAPLDWGLGHTTRCIGLMNLLIAAGHKLTFAGNDVQIALIHEIFPEIETLSLSGYEVKYARFRATFMFKLLGQLPRLLQVIKAEHQWLENLESERKFDLIISDNRYGLYSEQTPSVIMTHQLNILSGMGKMVDRRVQKMHYRFLERFRQCWVIDYEQEPYLSGVLGHPTNLPQNVVYVGPLSQFSIFENQDGGEIPPKSPKPKRTILFLLSGPEPLRTQLEEKLLKICPQLMPEFKIIFVSGSKRKPDHDLIPKGGMDFYQLLSASRLYPLLKTADLVVCRSGYSSLMDLAFLKKKALIIPTPGQTEQEYLSRFWENSGFAQTITQDSKDIVTRIKYCFAQKNDQNYPNSFPFSFESLNKIIDNTL